MELEEDMIAFYALHLESGIFNVDLKHFLGFKSTMTEVRNGYISKVVHSIPEFCSIQTDFWPKVQRAAG